MKKYGTFTILSLLVLSYCFVTPSSLAYKVEPHITIKAKPFELSQVRLLDGSFKDAMEFDIKYLHALDPDRLLHNFRVNAGLPSSAQPLGGWEEPDVELRGHSVGHYMSACALAYAASDDKVLKEKAEKIVAELAKCQKALGSGYLSAYPESFIDRVEAYQRVWAPYYTLHKILAGLFDVYKYCDCQEALDTAVNMARWCKGRCDKLSDEQMENMLRATEQSGMNEVLSNIYAATGQEWIFKLARRFDEKAYTEPLFRHEDNMTGQHVNSFIPNIVGTAREYELTGGKKEYEIATYFWDQVANHRSYATGGTSNSERWQVGADILSTQLGTNSHESCCTYNILKLTRHLFMWEPRAEYADFYERGILNGILSTIHPKTGMTMYYVPMASGSYKTFGTPLNSFWCCTGTGMENHVKYGDSIYFYDDEGLFVNLFIASKLNWKERDIVIRQETKFPEQAGTSLILEAEKPSKFAFKIRVPYWATKGLKVSINGKAEEVKTEPASYLVLNRLWQDGDRIDIEMLMSLHLSRTPDDKSVFAIMYGPVVLAGQLGSEGEMQQGRYGPVESSVVAPGLLGIEGKDINEWIRPVDDAKLTFRTVYSAKPEDITLMPFYKLFDQRYIIYWKSYDSEIQMKEEQAIEQQEQRRRRERAQRRARFVDSVRIGNDDSEREHQLSGEEIVKSTYNNRNSVQANPGGWFSVQLKVLPDRPVVLMCTYWGADTGNRAFDILIDGEKIATQKIRELSPGQFVDVEYRIPQELTKDKEQLIVKFEPHPDNIAGGIFGIAILTPSNGVSE